MSTQIIINHSADISNFVAVTLVAECMTDALRSDGALMSSERNISNGTKVSIKELDKEGSFHLSPTVFEVKVIERTPK
jgi:hypothetical protein